MSNTEVSPAQLGIVFGIMRKIGQLGHSLELCLLLKHVWISQAIECYVVRFELFLHLCSSPQRWAKKIPDEMTYGKLRPCICVPGCYCQLLEDLLPPQRRLFAAQQGPQYPKALKPRSLFSIFRKNRKACGITCGERTVLRCARQVNRRSCTARITHPADTMTFFLTSA